MKSLVVGAGPIEIPPHLQRRCGVIPPDSSGAGIIITARRLTLARHLFLFRRFILFGSADTGAAKQKDFRVLNEAIGNSGRDRCIE